MAMYPTAPSGIISLVLSVFALGISERTLTSGCDLDIEIKPINVNLIEWRSVGVAGAAIEWSNTSTSTYVALYGPYICHSMVAKSIPACLPVS